MATFEKDGTEVILAEPQLSLGEKLMRIQTELKAPKNLRNTFGNYDYRNAEGIMEALKPFESKYNVYVLISDEIMEISGRFYVKATASIFDCYAMEKISASAFAREDETKKGMDASQITGACSSYARKFALNALLLIDDSKDADSDEYQNESKARAKTPADTKKAKSSENETPEVTKQKAKEAYRSLIQYCTEHDHDIKEVAQRFSLNAKSTAEEFELAIRKLIYSDSKKANDMPEEV